MYRNSVPVLLILILVTWLPDRPSAAAEADPPATPSAAEPEPDYPSPPASDSSPKDAALTFSVNDRMRETFGKAIYENEIWTMERNRAVYAWQDFSTRLIFAAVLLLVFTGVFFSGLQFFRGYRAMKDNGNDTSVSHVEISASGVKVSSPFLGVVILVVSLAFFYLYLVYVYPISLTH